MSTPTRRSLLHISGSLLASAFLAGCTGAVSTIDETTSKTTSEAPQVSTGNRTRESSSDVHREVLDQLVAGNTAFAVDLLDQLVHESPETNLFVSPYSISVALAMTYAGAREKTATQMAEAMHYRLEQNRLHPAFDTLAQQIEDAESGDEDTETREGETPFQLTTANSLWGLKGYPYRESFLDKIAANYGAGLRLVDFVDDPEGARKRINEWVAGQTNEKIEDLLPKGALSTLTRLVLANAIYFKANWESTFSKAVTEDGSFTALDGSTSSVPMMTQQESFPYAKRDGHQLIELPYVGGQVGMIIILPPDGKFEQFERSLTAEQLTQWVNALESQSGEITLPRFSYESKFRLSKVLKALGMPIAFDPQKANFGEMANLQKANENLYISDVFHKSHIAVDEQGTEAAAATGVVMDAASASANLFEMTADRPFLFLIRERESGSVLFLGRVVDASEAQ